MSAGESCVGMTPKTALASVEFQGNLLCGIIEALRGMPDVPDSLMEAAESARQGMRGMFADLRRMAEVQERAEFQRRMEQYRKGASI